MKLFYEFYEYLMLYRKTSEKHKQTITDNLIKVFWHILYHLFHVFHMSNVSHMCCGPVRVMSRELFLFRVFSGVYPDPSLSMEEEASGLAGVL